MKYKAVIFDFFGVISSEVAHLWFEKYFPDSQIEKLKKKYVFPADCGAVSCDRMMGRLGKLVGISSEQVKEEWESEVIIDEKVISLIKKIKTKCKVALVSDAPRDFLRKILRQNKIEKLFNLILISSELRMTKSNKKIFRLALKRLRVKAPETIFVDDDLSHVRRSEEMGIKGLVFRSEKILAKQLRSALR
jgi:HAD superfamily hydrolase (TIGR01509 family)